MLKCSLEVRQKLNRMACHCAITVDNKIKEKCPDYSEFILDSLNERYVMGFVDGVLTRINYRSKKEAEQSRKYDLKYRRNKCIT